MTGIVAYSVWGVFIFHPCSILRNDVIKSLRTYILKYSQKYVRNAKNVRPQRRTLTYFDQKIKTLIFIFAGFLQLGPSSIQNCISFHQRTVHFREVLTETQATQKVHFLWVRPQRGCFCDLSCEPRMGLEWNFLVLYIYQRYFKYKYQKSICFNNLEVLSPQSLWNVRPQLRNCPCVNNMSRTISLYFWDNN